MTARFVLGIDLGTTNSVVAYAPLDTEQAQVELLDIPQLTDAGTVEPLASLASFTYLASGHPAGVTGGGGLDLPWATDASGAAVFAWNNAPEGEYYTEVVEIVADPLIWDGVTPPNDFSK